MNSVALYLACLPAIVIQSQPTKGGQPPSGAVKPSAIDGTDHFSGNIINNLPIQKGDGDGKGLLADQFSSQPPSITPAVKDPPAQAQENGYGVLIGWILVGIAGLILLAFSAKKK